MLKENKVINGLWIGSKLSPLELLTLHSFVNHGHIFQLWLYDEVENTLPEGVIRKDANTIIPKRNIFRKKSSDPKHGVGKGSYGSPFSDLFRYKLLYEIGGWWVDMDVTCLKPFEFDNPYFFRDHPILPMIGNVIKVPKGSELMKRTFEQTLAECDENTEEWLKPNKILNANVQTLNLERFIQRGMGNIDWWEEVEPFLQKSKSIPENWHFIHWMNEEWQKRGISKSTFDDRTYFTSMCQLYGIRLVFNKRKLPKWLTKFGFNH